MPYLTQVRMREKSDFDSFRVGCGSGVSGALTSSPLFAVAAVI
jgi:hypothetical protein